MLQESSQPRGWPQAALRPIHRLWFGPSMMLLWCLCWKLWPHRTRWHLSTLSRMFPRVRENPGFLLLSFPSLSTFLNAHCSPRAEMPVAEVWWGALTRKYRNATGAGLPRSEWPLCWGWACHAAALQWGFLWLLPATENIQCLELLPNITLKSWPGFTRVLSLGPNCQIHSLSLSLAQASAARWLLLPFLHDPGWLGATAIPLSPPFTSSFSPLDPPSYGCHRDSISEDLPVWVLLPRPRHGLPPLLHLDLNFSVPPPGSLPWLHQLWIPSPCSILYHPIGTSSCYNYLLYFCIYLFIMAFVLVEYKLPNSGVSYLIGAIFLLPKTLPGTWWTLHTYLLTVHITDAVSDWLEVWICRQRKWW